MVAKFLLVVAIVAIVILFPSCTRKPVMERCVVHHYRAVGGLASYNGTHLVCIEHHLSSYHDGLIGHLGDTVVANVSDSHF